ncbi:O-antigen ligase family protein [Dryocola sp. LX212]
MYSNNRSRIENAYAILFVAFIFMSSIFCNVSKVNLLFHSSLILLIGGAVFSSKIRDAVLADKDFLKRLAIPMVFLAYFTLSNIWSGHPGNISSTVKHSIYLIAFICIYRQVELMGLKKYVICAAFLGMTVLAILTLTMVDKTTLTTHRLEDAFPWAPDNVIDLGGYMVIGIFCGMIFIRESGKNWLYALLPILFISLLLTQSRGPLIAFIAAFSLLFIVNPRYSLKNILYAFLIIFIVALLIYLTKFSDILIFRIENLYKQSFIRFGIWQNAIEIAKDKPFFGWGYDKGLVFVNSIGQNITTTHTIYLASFLKGGIVGLLLMLSVVVLGLFQIRKHLLAGQKTEVSIFIFSLIYYMSQGMFIIGNPQEFWFLFWFPLAVILSTPVKKLAD